MSTMEKTLQIQVQEEQLRMAASEVTTALSQVLGLSAIDARSRLRFGPGATYERLARLLDKALMQAEASGLDPHVLVVDTGHAAAAEDIVRIRRKAHGLADWISSPASDVSLTLRPRGLMGSAASEAPTAHAVPAAERVVLVEPDTQAALDVREALYDVIDPDLGINVVDLGFVRRVEVDPAGLAHITMTLTSAACPLTEVMERNIEAVLAKSGSKFELTWEWVPSWRPSDINSEGREQLQAIGFTAF
ncbi:iron-sulfur cluster assembly protein [Glutamicibacter sp. NPDC087344]|uniref:iron-sulfur cluster assembly protein n=1 Tax=Glutamicibacter sp. NPDC087344 TaxID=3363994 RepID=UPI0038259AF8